MKCYFTLFLDQHKLLVFILLIKHLGILYRKGLVHASFVKKRGVSLSQF